MGLKHKKKKHTQKEQEEIFKEEDDVLRSHSDPDGKIIFLNKNITPVWLVEELLNRFRGGKNRGPKCGGLPA
ncbi:MAG: hypothetical protein ACXVLQ_04445 [Bacteriovorax sp.]